MWAYLVAAQPSRYTQVYLLPSALVFNSIICDVIYSPDHTYYQAVNGISVSKVCVLPNAVEEAVLLYDYFEAVGPHHLSIAKVFSD